jgi:hypothetical protein
MHEERAVSAASYPGAADGTAPGHGDRPPHRPVREGRAGPSLSGESAASVRAAARAVVGQATGHLPLVLDGTLVGILDVGSLGRSTTGAVEGAAGTRAGAGSTSGSRRRRCPVHGLRPRRRDGGG